MRAWRPEHCGWVLVRPRIAPTEHTMLPQMPSVLTGIATIVTLSSIVRCVLAIGETWCLVTQLACVLCLGRGARGDSQSVANSGLDSYSTAVCCDLAIVATHRTGRTGRRPVAVWLCSPQHKGQDSSKPTRRFIFASNTETLHSARPTTASHMTTLRSMADLWLAARESSSSTMMRLLVLSHSCYI